MEKKRLFFLDNLKVWLTVLVIVHHAAVSYCVFGAWPYKASNPDEMIDWIWHFLSTNASFFMGLYFLISGYFVPASYNKQGPKTFVIKKLTRLGIPLLIVGGLLSVLSGKLEMAHLWFLQSLLMFCLIYAGIRLMIKPKEDGSSNRVSWLILPLLAIVMGVGGHLIRQVSPQDNWIDVLGFLHIEPAHYLQYVMMFALGVLCNRYGWIENMGSRMGLCTFVIGVALVLGNLLRDGGPWNDLVDRYFGIYESFLCIYFSFGLLWIFREFGNGDSSVMRWASAQSYGAYVIHLFVMLALEFTFDKVWMGHIGKFVFIAVVSTLMSFGASWLLRKIPGVGKVL